MRRPASVLSVLLLAASAVAATAAEPPTFAEKRTFFHCAGTKVANASAVTGDLPSWNTTAPTASVQSGAGCGSTNTPAVGGTGHAGLYDAVFTGTHVGNIKDITVELHSIYASGARAGSGVPFGTSIELLVDGVRYAPSGVVTATPVPSTSRASEKVTFTLSGFDLTEDLDGDRVPDAGPGKKVRTISVKVRNGYTNQAGAFVYDTVEVPSGLTFNPVTREAVVAGVVKD